MLQTDPILYFNAWLQEPLVVGAERSVLSVMDALNRHPLAQDETANDYIMPAWRYREMAGRFRVYGENQDTFYCFVYTGAELEADPPVYFESCLDLKLDYGLADGEIINGDHVLVCPRFSDFLWHMLGQQICIRTQGNGLYRPDVCGVVFKECIDLDASFVNPLGKEFPAGYTCFVSDKVICVPDWGAAFLNDDSRRRFLERFSPIVSESWA
jgi:hypothetical protein